MARAASKDLSAVLVSEASSTQKIPSLLRVFAGYAGSKSSLAVLVWVADVNAESAFAAGVCRSCWIDIAFAVFGIGS